MAFAYFDGTLTNDQFYDSLQAVPLTDVWITRKKTKADLEAFCTRLAQSPGVQHVAVRSQGIIDLADVQALASLVNGAPDLRFLDLSI